MKKKELGHFRKILEKRLNELLGEADRTIGDLTSLNETFPDPNDRASFESDVGIELRIRDREWKLIKKIQEAIQRVEKGTYGICEECGEDISFKRLEARPVTTLCIECKSRQERMEKERGE
jgi:DnaK suppressor protein